MIVGVLVVLVPLLLLYLALRINRLRFRPEGTLDLRAAVVLRLVQRGERARRGSPEPFTLEQQRAELDALARRFAGGGPRMKVEREVELPGPAGPIPARLYRHSSEEFGRPDSDLPLLLYLHGGSFALGSLDTHNNVCRALARAAECTVLSIGYRLAPEHPYPAGVDDAYAALCWAKSEGRSIAADPGRIAVAGDSAGGTLAAAICLMARDRGGPRICHQALVYPATDATTIERESYSLYGEGYMLDTAQILWAREQYLPDPQDRFLPYASPLMASSHAGLPPATMVTAEFDVLRDEGGAYAEALERAGVPVRYQCVPGVTHSFFSAQWLLPQARRVVRLIAGDLNASWGG
jgi:acetyl esterase